MAKQNGSTKQKPNFVFIMGDDIGWFNIGAYHQGMMAGRTPNIDRLASEGMRFTDYYAEASCTAGRANFITGELPIRTGLTTVGQAGAPIGLPAQAPTIATHSGHGLCDRAVRQEPLWRPQRVSTDRSRLRRVLWVPLPPRCHGRPGSPELPKELKDTIGPRNMLHAYATDKDDPTVQPRWGKVGKQKIEDAGTLYPKRMETVDDEILDHTFKFIDKAKSQNKPFFIWLNPTRMHVVTHLSEKYEKMRTPENGWTVYEAGMAQIDDMVGAVMKKLEDDGLADNTVVVFTTDNGAENFTWPDGGQTPFAGGKGTVLDGGFRVPCVLRWPGKFPPAKWRPVSSRGSTGFRPSGCCRQCTHRGRAEEGQGANGTTYRVHLDGYDQTALLTGKGPSARNEVYYFAESTLGAVRLGDYKFRFIDQPSGWLGGTVKVDWPLLVNLRLDPSSGPVFRDRSRPSTGSSTSSGVSCSSSRRSQVRADLHRVPPMQAAATFNLDALKAQVLKAMQSHHGA